MQLAFKNVYVAKIYNWKSNKKQHKIAENPTWSFLAVFPTKKLKGISRTMITTPAKVDIPITS